MERVGILRRMQTVGLLLALFALTFKAFLPPGFMVTAHADRIAIVHCNGAESVLVLGHDQEAPADNSSRHCPFAQASAPLLPTPVAFTYAPVTYPSVELGERIVERPHDISLARGPPLPARGPPIQA
jgi:hypothetical protein